MLVDIYEEPETLSTRPNPPLQLGEPLLMQLYEYDSVSSTTDFNTSYAHSDTILPSHTSYIPKYNVVTHLGLKPLIATPLFPARPSQRLAYDTPYTEEFPYKDKYTLFTYLIPSVDAIHILATAYQRGGFRINGKLPSEVVIPYILGNNGIEFDLTDRFNFEFQCPMSDIDNRLMFRGQI
ncbi:hypothetical protein B0H19DRAFT_1060122 [Mycena capillaripes]|nr:hypothetical protein B0H19DRAFT_1060122 [Mycena capillaripes]